MMHNYRTRSRGKAVSALFAPCIAVAITLTAAIYCASMPPAAPQVRASALDSGALSSSPASGPVGTTLTVTGSGWSQADGTSVYLGYILNASCNLDSDSQNGSFSAGSFSGWLRWPLSTPPATYTVCAIFSSSAQIYVAGSFTVLSASAPQVSIAPGALQENQHATITATNYLPSGTSVTFYWVTTGGKVLRTIGAATSNSSGTASFSFSFPVTKLASGQYQIQAAGGGGQPPALFSSTSFSYSAPVAKPSPTPVPSATPPPFPTQYPTQAATATVTAGATVLPDPTGVPTTKSAGGAGVTPTTSTNGTGLSPTATTGSGGSGSSTGVPDSIILSGAIIALLAVLIVVLVIALLRRRKQTREDAKLSASALSPFTAGSFSAQTIPGAPPMPGMFPPVPQPAPAGQYMANGTLPGFSGLPTPSPPAAGNGPVQAYSAALPAGPAPMQAPLPYRSLLRSMMPLPADGAEGPRNGDGHTNANGALSAPADPTLDAIRREAQVGLYVAPVPRGGNGAS